MTRAIGNGHVKIAPSVGAVAIGYRAGCRVLSCDRPNVEPTAEVSRVRKRNDSYCVVFQGDRIVERYYRDKSGWLKVSNRGRVFRMTAEQVLNHVLPALAFGDSLGLRVTVEHYEHPYWETVAGHEHHSD